MTREEAFSILKEKKIEIFFEEMNNKRIYKDRNSVDLLVLYKDLSRNESKKLLKKPRQIIGFSLLIGFILGIIMDSFKALFLEVSVKNPITFVILFIAFSYLGYYCLLTITNIKESYFEYLNKRSKKYEEIAEWIDLIIVNEKLR